MWGRGQRPVINVSWEDAKAYTEWLSEQTGKEYRLPTEAEWEWAASFNPRLVWTEGSGRQTWAGTSNEGELGDFAIYSQNSGLKTAPVGSKKPNVFGLYDMSGNVWEWVMDCWTEDYMGAPTDGSAGVVAGSGDCGRVFRGGAFNEISQNMHASTRNFGDVRYQGPDVGFRLAQDIEK